MNRLSMNPSSESPFATSVRREFAFLKAATHLEGTFSRGIHLPTSGGLAIPLTQANCITSADDAILANPEGYKNVRRPIWPLDSI